MARRDEIGEPDRSTEGRGRTALVTGASSGIGEAFARLLAAKGYDVIPLARRAERLEALSLELGDRWDVQATPLVADLADPALRGQAVERLKAEHPRVDFLVNNAGNSRIGRYEQQSWETHHERVQMMILASMELSYAVLPHMVEQRWGRIATMSSIAGVFTCFPNDITYGAIKKMLVGFSEGVHSEYSHLGINATVSLPGPTATEVFTTPGSARDVAAAGPARKMVMSPESVARITYDCVMAGKPWVVPGKPYMGFATALQYTPGPARRWLSKALCARM